MPQNTPMKRQFTTIDGRTVMSNLPQHWGGNDWAITGVDNPLPVGNYVQTEAGVWIPQKGSDDGAVDVRLTGSIVKQLQVGGGGNEVSLAPNESFLFYGGPNYGANKLKVGFSISTSQVELWIIHSRNPEGLSGGANQIASEQLTPNNGLIRSGAEPGGSFQSFVLDPNHYIANMFGPTVRILITNKSDNDQTLWARSYIFTT